MKLLISVVLGTESISNSTFLLGGSPRSSSWKTSKNSTNIGIDDKSIGSDLDSTRLATKATHPSLNNSTATLIDTIYEDRLKNDP